MRGTLLASLAAVTGCAVFWEVPSTPLHEASWRGDVAAIRQLVKDGADPNIRSDQGMSAMDMATVEGAPTELMELMRAKGFKAQAKRLSLP